MESTHTVYSLGNMWIEKYTRVKLYLQLIACVGFHLFGNADGNDLPRRKWNKCHEVYEYKFTTQHLRQDISIDVVSISQILL